jgi:hypothetical protein
MRRGGVLLLGLWAGSFAGCVAGQPMPAASWREALTPPDGPDVVRLETALIEVPVGDRFINHELWTLADDQVLRLEQQALLEENGFRVGQFGGVTPAELQTLLVAKRTWGNPRRIQQHAGMPARLPLGPMLPVCRFDLRLEDRTTPVSLEQAECALVVVPTLTADGRTRLQFTPEIPHGQATVMPQPTADRSTWMFQKQQATETYPALSWEVTLEANEFVIVGGQLDRPDTLGHRCFVRGEEAVPRQRLLVIHTARLAAAPPADNDGNPGEAEGASSFDRALPLALQAALGNR